MTDDATQERPLRPFPIQLIDVHCAVLRGERRDRRDDDPEDQALEVESTSTDLAAERLAFNSRLIIRLVAPVFDAEAVEIEIVVQGSYVSAAAMDPDLYAQFIQYTPVVQLWPYARAYLAQASSALGVELPVLPLIDALSPADDQAAESTPEA